MGLSTHATAAIGLFIAKDQLYKRVVQGAAAHEHQNPPNAKCCMECGVELAKCIKKIPHGGEDDGEEDVDLFSGDEFFGYEIITSAADEDHVLLAATHTTTNRYKGDNKFSVVFSKMEEAPDVLDIMKQMREKLEPLGIWDDSNFGIWAIDTSNW